MKFVHGSKQKIDEFKLFDYTKDPENKFDNESIDNGNDQHGPGIYCLCIDDPEKQKRAVEYAERYAGKDGYLYFFSVETKDDEMLNNFNEEYIAEEDWALLVQNMINEHRRSHTEEYFDEVINDFAYKIEEGEEINLDELNKALEGYDFDKYEYDPKDYSDPDEWRDALKEAFYFSDPASFILENGGPEGVARYAMESSESSWDVLKKIWNLTAVLQTGKGIETYNQSFYRAAFKTFKENTPPGCYIEEDDFHVIFDVDSIKIEKVIEMKPVENELEY